MLEALSTNDTTVGYRKKSDGSGKYVRKRVVRKRSARPNFIVDISDSDDSHYSRPSRARHNVIVPAVSSTYSVNRGESGIFLGVSNSVAEENSNFHLGLEAEGPMANEWMMWRLGASLFKSDYLYAGGTLGARAMVPDWRLSPYVGVEGYLGDHKQCEYEDIGYDEELETCEKVFLATLYTELGLRLKLTGNMNLYAFTRGYSKVDQTIREDLSMFYGASLFFTY